MLRNFSLLLFVFVLAACSGKAGDGPAKALVGPPAQLDQAGALRDLAAMPAPAGVDSAVWATLRDELYRLLAAPANATRGVSVVPTGATAAPDLVVERSGNSGTFSWHHTLPGDYDQNGVVNITDLTPLGAHFNESSPGGFDPLLIQYVIDGDGNGEINLADVTPIGQHFGETVTAYEFFVSTNFADYPDSNGDPAVLAPLSVHPLSSFAGTAGQTPLSITLEPITMTDDALYWVRPSDGTSLGTPSARIFGSPPPIIQSITVSPDPVPSGGTAVVHVAIKQASTSGSEPSIAWQLAGDGSIDPFGETVNFTAPVVGSDNHVTLTVAVADGLHEVFAERPVVIWAGSTERWHSQTVTSEQIAGVNSALFNTPGGILLSFSYQGDGFADQLVSATATNHTGTDWTFLGEHDPVNFVDASGAYIEGLPALAVSHFGGISFSIHSFGSFSPFFQLPGTPVNCIELSMTQVAGQPAVAFQAAVGPSYDVLYSRAINYELASWNAPNTAVHNAEGQVGTFLSLVDVDGRPAVCYLDTTTVPWSLRYALGSDANGGSWNDLHVYHHPDGWATGRHCVMDIVDGRPAIAFQVTSLGLHYIRAEDSLGQTWPLDAIHLDGEGEGLDLELIGFEPAIAYEWRSGNAVESELRFIRATNVQGSAWEAPESADEFMNGLQVGSSIRPSMKDVAGHPAISYYDPVNRDLKYAVKY